MIIIEKNLNELFVKEKLAALLHFLDISFMAIKDIEDEYGTLIDSEGLYISYRDFYKKLLPPKLLIYLDGVEQVLNLDYEYGIHINSPVKYILRSLIEKNAESELVFKSCLFDDYPELENFPILNKYNDVTSFYYDIGSAKEGSIISLEKLVYYGGFNLSKQRMIKIPEKNIILEIDKDPTISEYLHIFCRTAGFNPTYLASYLDSDVFRFSLPKDFMGGEDFKLFKLFYEVNRLVRDCILELNKYGFDSSIFLKLINALYDSFFYTDIDTSLLEIYLTTLSTTRGETNRTYSDAYNTLIYDINIVVNEMLEEPLFTVIKQLNSLPEAVIKNLHKYYKEGKSKEDFLKITSENEMFSFDIQGVADILFHPDDVIVKRFFSQGKSLLNWEILILVLNSHISYDYVCQLTNVINKFCRSNLFDDLKQDLRCLDDYRKKTPEIELYNKCMNVMDRVELI